MRRSSDTIQVSGGVVCQVDRSYAFPNGPSAVRVATADGGGLHWQAADQHGTGTVDIDAADLTVTRRRYTPFGQDRTLTGTGGWAGDKGFVGGTRDDTNQLTNLGAREYSPALGRFLSPDPDLDHSDPQALNNYAYSDNAPTNKTDPNGERLACTAAIPCGPTDKHHLYGKYYADSRFTGSHRTIGYSNGHVEHYSCNGWSHNGYCGRTITFPGHCTQSYQGQACVPPKTVDISKVNWNTVLQAYLNGMGGTFYFHDGDYFAEQMKKDPYLRNVIMHEIAAKIAAGKPNGISKKSYYGKAGVKQGAKDANPRNMEVFEIGSYHVAWRKSGKTSSGRTKVTLHVTNFLSNESIAHYTKAFPDQTSRVAARAGLDVANNVPNVGTDFTITMTVP